MTARIVVLKEDKTGLSVDNLIHGEVHSPPPGKLRLVIPSWGAFFGESLQVIDEATSLPVAAEHYILGDVWQQAQLESGKSVVCCFLLKETAPVDVQISYQAYGGPSSRNAQEIVNWLNEHLASTNETIAFKDLKDLPKQYQPSEHKHLLAHVFGMEYLVAQLHRLEQALDSDRENQIQVEYEIAKQRVARMAAASDTTVTALVTIFWNKWKEQLSLYALGIDLLKNYPALGAGGVYASAPTFSVENEADERYVDIAGLGAFSKGLVERVVSGSTGLGLDLAIEAQAQRGSFIGALVGETFHLPSPAIAKQMDYVNLSVYPKNWPSNHAMVVVKQMGNFGNYGGVFSAFDAVNGNQYIGILSNDTWKTPLVWSKVYHHDETTALSSALEVHVTGKGAIHEETSEQIGLGHLENLPVVSEDTIVTGESKRHMLTYDSLMAFVRVHQEAIKLARDSKGEVDYTDTMDKTRVIINSGSCAITPVPKDQFISSFCDGTDKYVRLSDGNNSYYDKLQESNSDDCGFAIYPAYGTKVSDFCDGTTLKSRYADGRGNYFTEVTKIYSESCGYVKPMALGTIISVFCSGVNQMTRYADGNGSSYDLPTQINTYLCGGTIYPSSGGGDTGVTDPGVTQEPLTQILRVSSTHKKLSKETMEVLSVYAVGLVPNATYQLDVLIKSPSFKSGATVKLYSAPFVANEQGILMWEQERTDDGVTQPRGEYTTWAAIESANLTSNQITRTFIASNTVQAPDILINAGGGEAGSGVADGAPPAQNVVGGDYDPSQPWPVVPAFNPSIAFSSSTNTLFTGMNETLFIHMRKFAANTTYTAELWYTHSNMGSAAPTLSSTVQLTTDAKGEVTHTIPVYDDGTLARGTTQNWIEVRKDSKTTKSNTVDRIFVTGSEATTPKRALKTTTSQSSISTGNNYSQSVVLTGGTPNTNYTLQLFRGTFTAAKPNPGVLINTVVVVTDGAGVARFDYSDTYDGYTPVGKEYHFYARLVGSEQMSTVSYVTFVAKGPEPTPTPTQPPKPPALSFASSHLVIRKGDSEILSATLSNYPANTTITVEFWNSSPGQNGNQDLRTHVATVRTDSVGSGVLNVTTQDDGVTVPRGDYQSWVVTTAPYATSGRIVRTFMATVVPTQPPSVVKVTYTSSLTTITPGSFEEHFITVTGLVPNSWNTFAGYLTSAALNNGMTPVKALDHGLYANSDGVGEFSYATEDDGVAVPRGTYSCWIECAGARSPSITRVFAGNVPVTNPYNPKIVHYKNTTSLSAGSADNSYVDLTGMKPNTSYTVELYIKGPNAFNNQAFRIALFQIVTDGAGAGKWSNFSTDDGVTIPRGTYSVWAEIPSLSLKSAIISVTWVGTASPTPPPYNPYINYYTNLSFSKLGTSVVNTVILSGMRPNTTYVISAYMQNPGLYDGVAILVYKGTMQTDSAGRAQYQSTQYDDGTTMPRGTHSNWAVIDGVGTTSSVFTRVYT